LVFEDLSNRSKVIKHAVTPIAIFEKGNGVFQLWVYQSNTPYDGKNPESGINQITIYPGLNKWEAGELSSANSPTFFIIPVSLLKGEQLLTLNK